MALATSMASRLGCTAVTFGGKLPEKLRAMQQAGFVATEFFPRDLFEDLRGPSYTVAALRDSGLAISAYQALRDYEGMPAAQRDQVLARHYRLFPGEGVAPMTEFVRRLEAIGYTGCYSVEVMNDHYLHDNPDAVARRAFEATLRMAAEI